MALLRYHMVILLLVWLLPGMAGKAQDPMFNHFTEDRELPSNQVYGMVLDADHVLYMVTDRGMAFFDGYAFRHLSANDGLLDNCILRINRDKDDRLWLTSLQKTANYFENGQLHKAGFSDSLVARPGSENFVQHIFVTNEGDTLVTLNHPGIFRATASGGLEQYTDHLADAGDAHICIWQTDGGFYWDLIRIPPIGAEKPAVLRKQENRFYITTSVKNNNSHQRKEIAVVSDDEFFFSYCYKVFHIRHDSLVGEYLFEHDILDLYYEPRANDLWVGVDHEGAYRYSRRDLNSRPRIYLRGQGVTTILRDHEKNYWFSVRDNGVYRANSLDHVLYLNKSVRPEDNRITALLSVGDQLLAGTHSGNLISLTQAPGGTYHTAPFPGFEPNGLIRKILLTRDNTILVFANSLYELDLTGRLTGFRHFGTFAYDFFELEGDTCVLAHSEALRIYKGRREIRDLKNHPGYSKVTQVMKVSSDEVWMSSRHNGLYTWDGKNDPLKFDAFNHLGTYRSNAMEMFKGSTVISPYGYGLYIMTEADTIAIKEAESGLSGNMVDYLLAEKDPASGEDSLLWVATNRGITLLSFPEGLSDRYESTQINTASGLPSNRINALALYDGHTWAATGAGLVRLTREVTHPEPLSPPVIRSVYVNDVAVESGSALELGAAYPYTIRFHYRTISYHQPHQIYYYYFMEGVDDPAESWAMTSDTEIRYTNMEEGSYRLYIHASRSPNLMLNDSTLPDLLVRTLPITIKPALHDTLGFRIGMVFLLLLIILLATLQVIKEIRKREKNKRRLLLAEKQALLSQMNPHFIFNSLNSIQHYIIEQDEENANLYLARFSQLIRRILDNSKKKWITLGEEVETIRLYLNLEKLRFEDHFEFQIIQSRDLDQHDIMIPPMMVQPFVENAIWHGIMPLKEQGLLTLRFEKKDKRMLVTVEDSGIGREAAARMKRISGHVPTGLSNVNERIVLLNKLMKEAITCEITDLKKPDGQAAGTRVELSIPIIQTID